MATPHPGKWETVLNQSSCAVDTEWPAVHACVIYNPNSPNILNWKVLYFFALQKEGDPQMVKSRIWNPNENAITKQVIPNWPPPETDPPMLFCAGHYNFLYITNLSQ